MLKHLLIKIRKLLSKARKGKPPEERASYQVRYTSVPSWKPWRDF